MSENSYSHTMLKDTSNNIGNEDLSSIFDNLEKLMNS